MGHVGRVLGVLLGAVVATEGLAQKGWPRGGSGTGDAIQASVLLTDLDADGKMEIAIVGFDDKLYVYNHDGTTRSGFPVTLGLGDGSISSVTVADLAGTGTPYLVVVGDDTSSKNAKIRYCGPSGGTVSQIDLGSSGSVSGKATIAAIDCQKYSGGTLHPSEELLLRDGAGQIHIIHRTGSSTYSDRFEDTTQFNTTFVQQDEDLSGSQPITPSMAAGPLPDGKTLIVAPSTDGLIHYWEVNSTVSVDWALSSRSTIDPGDDARFYSSPALVDLDGDGGLDIVAATSAGNVYVWDYLDGRSLRDGWEQATGNAIFSSPAVADIDGSGGKEVVIGADSGKVFAWHSDGSSVSGWPVQTGGAVFGSPVLADIDPRSGVEVIVGVTDGRLYAWGVDGAALEGWPKRLNAPVYGSVAVGDIHESLKYSVLVPGFDGRVFCFDMFHRYDPELPGWFQFRGGASRLGTHQ